MFPNIVVDCLIFLACYKIRNKFQLDKNITLCNNKKKMCFTCIQHLMEGGWETEI